MKSISTIYGELKAVSYVEYYSQGRIKSVRVEEESTLNTPYGKLIPNYSMADVRKKYREAVTFFEDGELESIYLEEPQLIHTPVGYISAELITFYPGGGIKRVFPLYGQIGGYWTENNEYELAKKIEIKLLDQVFNVAPLCILFFPSGNVKSLTIWPFETISVNTEYGPVKTRFGFELSEDGRLKSIEPAFGVSLETKNGVLYPYDIDNYRLHAENNSLVFDREGKIKSAFTIKNKMLIKNGEKKPLTISADPVEDPLTGKERPSSLNIVFGDKWIAVNDRFGAEKRFDSSSVLLVE